jgi:hypothetical protein
VGCCNEVYSKLVIKVWGEIWKLELY